MTHFAFFPNKISVLCNTKKVFKNKYYCPATENIDQLEFIKKSQKKDSGQDGVTDFLPGAHQKKLKLHSTDINEEKSKFCMKHVFENTGTIEAGCCRI